MLTIPGYEIREKLYEGAHSLVYRAIRKENGKSVIVKVLQEKTLSADEMNRFEREYQINCLIEAEGGEKVYALEKVGQTYAMILEDIGGRSVTEIMGGRKLSIKDAMSIAIQISKILSRIHAANIIHKDINPSNIIWNTQTGRVQLIDYGIASTLPRERQQVVNPKLLEGTLSYISPEQTGRMNRGIDERADYYSLGVTLYQMLTGSLPFESDDPMELVYLQIAKQPDSPNQTNPEVPEVLSNIILKMMAKTAEDRYQSARGLEFDLTKCLEALKMTGKVEVFPLATHDISEHFQISGKLYDRRKELAQLLGMYEQAALGKIELMLVSGYSGIGKTALVLEVHKPIVEKRGYFISGKFEPNRLSPYLGIILALKDWVRQILMEGSETFAEWKRILLASIGPSGDVITDLVPDFEEIIGPQPKPAELGSTEAQERFTRVFVKLLQTLAKPSHPLVLFLDDFHHADAASLNFLKKVLLSNESKYLLIIGAYRDNEPGAEEIRNFVKNDLQKESFFPELLTLTALPFDDLWQMLTDTLQMLPDQVRPLAEICYSRSGGNPFFFIQLLKYIHYQNLIQLNPTREHWIWDLEQIKQQGITENIADLISDRIKKMPPATQTVLLTACCIGYRFDLLTLANVYGQPVPDTLQALWPALQEEILFPEDESYKYISLQSKTPPTFLVPFRFAHDRVQQAIYTMLTKEKKEEIHYQIGEYLLKSFDKEKLEENIFSVVNQLNKSEKATLEKEKKNLIVQLNLLAGEKAKKSAAFETAVTYFQIAKGKLGEKAWDTDYALNLSILKDLAECLYNLGQGSEADQYIQEILLHTKTALEKSDIYILQGKQVLSLGQFDKAIDCGIMGLKLLGVKLSKKPSTFSILKEFAFARMNLGRRSIPSLLNAPLISSPRIIQIIKLLNLIPVPSFYSTELNLYAYVIIKTTNLLLRYGNIPEAALTFSYFGILLHSFLYDLKNGHEFMKLSLALNDKYEDIINRPAVLMVQATFVIGYEKHWKTIRDTFDKGIELGFRIGDAFWAVSMCAQAVSWDPNMPQDIYLVESTKYEKLIDRKRFDFYWNLHKMIQHFHMNLGGMTTDRFSMSSKNFDEYVSLQFLRNTKFHSALGIAHYCKAFVCFTYDKFWEALLEIRASSKYILGIQGTLAHTEFIYYSLLIYVGVFHQLSWQDKIKAIFIMKGLLWRMRRWAAFCPINFLHKQYTLEAEYARLWGQKKKAAKLYEKAIKAAQEYNFINMEAIATELAAKFYLANNQITLARTLMQQSYAAYQKWGAKGKLEYLSEIYPNLLAEQKAALTAVSAPAAIPYAALDITEVVNTFQSIAEEMVLEKLITKSMQTAISNSGAEKGWFLVEKEGSWIIEAEATRSEVRLVSKSIEQLPQTIINMVIYDKTPVTFSNPSWLNQFTSDPYIQKVTPKAVLGLPLLNQGKLTGILYLENNSVPDVFTKERMDSLALLGSQIAISLDNARLYTNLLTLNENLRKINDSTYRFIPQEFIETLGKRNIMEVGIGDSVAREMTILFTDIRGFTSRSEKMTPQECFKFLNDFLKEMAPIIRAHQGFIDKYLGDGFMAIFLTSADTALQAATSMLTALKEINLHLLQKEIEPLQIGIGLDSGEALMGAVGEERRLDETVLSDVVSSAMQLQNKMKIYGANLIISQETLKRLNHPEQRGVRMLDIYPTIYEVFEMEDPNQIFLKRQSRPDFEKAISFFYQNQAPEATALFAQIIQANPQDLPASRWLSRLS